MRGSHAAIVGLAALVLATSIETPARADLLPGPEVPADWDEYPPPQPLPPPEKEDLHTLWFAAAALGLLAWGVTMVRRRTPMQERGA